VQRLSEIVSKRQKLLEKNVKYLVTLYLVMVKRRKVKKMKKGKIASQSFGGGSVPKPNTSI